MLSFWQEPLEIANYIKSKKSEIHFDYDEILYEAHHKAFTIAKITKIDLLNDIKDSLENSFKSGITFKQWKQDITPTLQDYGWIGKTIVTNPQNGESKEIYVSSRRLKNIYNTNIRASYAKTRYENQMNSLGQYFRYVSVLDSKTRHAHKKLHGTILPKTDSFWDKNYPPNDWGCRCRVQVLSDEEMKTKGLIPLTDSSMLNDIASNDWAYNPSKGDNLGELLEKKAKQSNLNLDSLKQYINLSAWQSGLDNMVDDILIKENLKTPIDMTQIGNLSNNIAMLSSKLLGLEVQGGGIILTKKELIHASPKRKETYNRAFRIEEIKSIVEILSDENNAYIDLRENHKNIVYIFEDKLNKNKINLIPIEISKIHKKFKQSNYVITLDKVDKIEIEQGIKGGIIKKIK